MSKLLLLLTTALLAISASADNFAVLIGGSNGYMNYRHHADVCHGYQILIARGIPAANIITFLYDDVANAQENPFPGKLFNAPTAKGVAGKDVYAGCKIDYKGKDVTPANFEAVLTGDASSAPKGHPVLKSTAADKVFVNFVDHGGVGIIAFPGALGQKLYHAADLMKVLKTMHDTKMFGELVYMYSQFRASVLFRNRRHWLVPAGHPWSFGSGVFGSSGPVTTPEVPWSITNMGLPSTSLTLWIMHLNQPTLPPSALNAECVSKCTPSDATATRPWP